MKLKNKKLKTNGRKNLGDVFCFSIDNKSTKAVDDIISIETINGAWKIGVHISDVGYFVKNGSAIGKEAAQRVASKYIGKFFFKPLLPREIY